MRILKAGSIAALLMLFHSALEPVVAQDAPLPERNPLRVIGMPLPERNPERLASEQVAALPLPERNPLRTVPEPDSSAPKVRPGKWPKLLPGTPEILKTWTDEETAAERERCVAILKDVAAEFEPADPVRQGGCGSAAPYKLSRIGSDPVVTITPPATVTCDMVAAMAEWMDRDVQPAAQRILGAPVTRISNISDYSCRAALSRTSTRLSEHALANALDVRDFITSKDETADLKRDWGLTQRDIAARIAAEKAAEAARQAAAAAAAEATAKAAKEAKASTEAASKVAKAEDKGGKQTAKDTGEEPPSPPAMVVGNASGVAAGRRLTRAELRRARREARNVKVASRLGGPAVAAREGVAPGVQARGSPANRGPSSRRAALRREAPSTAAEAETPRRQFLREIHAKACQRFGTVLGPEANEAHRDHFHLDMAKRRHRSFCE